MHQNLQAAKILKKLTQIVDKGHQENVEYGRSVAKKIPPSKEGRSTGAFQKSDAVIDAVTYH